MIHIFKAGGPWKDESGLEYTIKAVSRKEAKVYLLNGWSASIDELKSDSVKELGVDGGSYERDLRDFIKSKGEKAGPRASIENLEAKAQELGYVKD